MMELGAYERRVMQKLGRGARLLRANGGWRLGTTTVADEVVARLRRHDLLCQNGDIIEISGPGQVWLMRAAAPEAPNRLLRRAISPDRKAVTVNLAESPLAWLARRRMISARQFEAGERLRTDFLIAGQAPRTTMRWDPAPPARGKRGPVDMLDPTAAQLAAKRRFEAATKAAGAGLADILWRVVCLGEGLETAERAMNWPSRSGKVVLGLALDRLADHFQI